ncbi:MAG TPA: DUF411 domain-containing protein [Candidatus Limnocylindria bacterium]|nr:DUF411 domain-containing protein [Candidatus Limnocylindria bacterium]
MKYRPATLLTTLLLALLLGGCAAAPPTAAPPAPQSDALAGVTAVVFRSPSCTCCHEHEAYMRAAGITVHSVVDDNLARVKESYGVPGEMLSCHTTAVEGYFVEGHVPLAAIERLLDERPLIDGIALPGMPAGSPGMGGTAKGPLTVFAVRDGGATDVFGEF